MKKWQIQFCLFPKLICENHCLVQIHLHLLPNYPTIMYLTNHTKTLSHLHSGYRPVCAGCLAAVQTDQYCLATPTRPWIQMQFSSFACTIAIRAYCQLYYCRNHYFNLHVTICQSVRQTWELHTTIISRCNVSVVLTKAKLRYVSIINLNCYHFDQRNI